MPKLSDLRLSKNMKYTALYVAMRFFEHEPNVFEKEYDNGVKIVINSENQSVFIYGSFAFELSTHESFVKLEFVNRLLSLGYSLDDFSLKENGAVFKGYDVVFYVWDDAIDVFNSPNMTVKYKSRLVSGVLEYKCEIKNDDVYQYGLFESKIEQPVLRKKNNNNYSDPDFEIEENRIMRYLGHSKKVVVPEGIEELES